jgi:uncharacterized Zn finger protein
MAVAVAPKLREGAAAKGRRYLTEGRLVVLSVHRGRVEALCRGDGHRWRCGYDGDWWCRCPARGVCAHLTALRLVVAPDL